MIALQNLLTFCQTSVQSNLVTGRIAGLSDLADSTCTTEECALHLCVDTTKFGSLMHFELLYLFDLENLKFLKSKMAAAVILKNRKISIYRPWFERIRRNLTQ